MMMLCSTTVLAFTSSLFTIHAAAAPLRHGAHQRRAVDVTAFIPNQGRPLPSPQSTPLPELEDRAVNPEGWVPYMHYPSEAAEPPEAAEPLNDKRAANLEGYVPYEHDTMPTLPLKSRSYGGERVPLHRPVPQQQDKTGGGLDTDGEARKRETDPILNNLHRKPVDVVPIVGRAVDPASFDDDGRVPVDRVPIVGRAVDPIVSENLHKKPVDVVPIVGRAVDVGALSDLRQKCGSEGQRYEPSAEFCDDQSVVQPLNSRSVSSPVIEEKRNAIPEPQTDKLTCNGERYLPSEQTCTTNGSLINTTPITPHNSAATPPPTNPRTKRAISTISHCGSGIGSIQYNRATSYCDPITQMVWPLSVLTELGPSRALSGRPGLIPLAAREHVPTLLGGQKPGSKDHEREYALVGPPHIDQRAVPPCIHVGDSVENELLNEDCAHIVGDPVLVQPSAKDAGVTRVGAPMIKHHESELVAPRSVSDATESLERDVPKSPSES